MIAVTSVLLAFAKNIILFSSLLILDYIFFSFADPARFALAGFVSRKKKGMLLSFFEFFSILIAAIVMLFFGKLVSLLNFKHENRKNHTQDHKSRRPQLCRDFAGGGGEKVGLAGKAERGA